MKKVINICVLENYRLELTFNDGVSGIADLSGLAGKGIFSIWNDYEVFRKVQIAPTGEIVWNDQIDLCPDSLYMKITDKPAEEIFPSLKQGIAYA